MPYVHNYAVAGLQEPGKYNVLSLEQKTGIGNLIRSDESGVTYKVLQCGEALPTEMDAAFLAINGQVTLWVEPTSQPEVTTRHSVASLPIDEWNSETSFVYEVVGERRDDLPCYDCGEHTNTLIVTAGKYKSLDLCHVCAMLRGIIW